MAVSARMSDFNPYFGFLRFFESAEKKAKAFLITQTAIVRSVAFLLWP